MFSFGNKHYFKVGAAHMKILQVNCVYKKGSTGNITYNLHMLLSGHGYDSRVIYGRGDKSSDASVKKLWYENYFRINGLIIRLTGIPYGGCHYSTYRLIQYIKKEKPDIVHLQCINGHFVNIYKLIGFLKSKNIKTVLTLHAEFMYTANCGIAMNCEKWKTGCGHCPCWRSENQSWLFDNTALSWKKMKSAFENFSTLSVVSVSPWLMQRAASSPILTEKNHFTVCNGIDTEIFKPRNTSELRARLGLNNEIIFIFVTSSFSLPLKGGKYVIDAAQRLLDSNIKIIVIGNTNSSMVFPKNVIDIGRVEDQKEMAKYYSLADATLITSYIETFSMPVAESLCCGTPIIGFEAGGPESIALKEYSTFVPYGDEKALLAVMQHTKKKCDSNNIVMAAQKLYSKERMFSDYLDIYEEILK